MQAIDPTIDERDLTVILYKASEANGAATHINSMNLLTGQGINQIITQLFKAEATINNLRTETEEDRSISKIFFSVSFPNVRLRPPETNKRKSGVPEPLMPNIARLRDLTYAGNMYLDAKIVAIATRHDGTTIERSKTIEGMRILGIPVMIKSDLCHLHGKSREELRQLNEDPRDNGGYFIIRGGEWVVDSLENTTNNLLHLYKGIVTGEHVQGRFLSKPGDAYENSYQLIFRYMESGAITVEITMNKTTSLIMPFFILFRALGMTCDADICDNIVYGYDNRDVITTHLLSVLSRAFDVVDPTYAKVHNSTDREQIISFLAFKKSDVKKAINPNEIEALKYLNNDILTTLDKLILPHLGASPEARITKLRDIGRQINRLLLCDYGIIDETDRDSFKNKRMNAAGTSLAKTIKTQFSQFIIRDVRKALMNEFKSVSFTNATLDEPVRSTIVESTLGEAICRSITSGNKTIKIKRREMVNRVSSQSLYWKNDLNVRSSLNQINTPDNGSKSKSSERATVMRLPHSTSVGFIDPIQSADSGEKVGISKQIAMTARICESSTSAILKATLLADDDIVPLARVSAREMAAQGLSRVFVNGAWVGFCADSYRLYCKYRDERRASRIHPHTSITWELTMREIYFWTDVGRITRPLMIVYNNAHEYMAAKRAAKEAMKNGDKTAKSAVQFRQWITLTKKHIEGLRSGAISLETLRTEQVIEYISADEQINLFLAPSLEKLRKRSGSYKWKYTHCEIPQAIFGLPTLASPLANCSQSVRNTMYTNHRKQSVGIPNINYPDRISKGTALQHYHELPMTSTITDSLMNPNGHNTIVAIGMYDGREQEDSVLINQSSVDCGMFNCSYYNYEYAELEADEIFGDINHATTMDIKKANYGHIVNGVVREGTIVHKDDVLIVKLLRLSTPEKQYTFTDRSVVYRNTEPMIVERVIRARNDADVPIIKVKLRANRPLGVGDKLSSRHGNKGICARTEPRINMPYFEDGSIPDVFINAQSITTRMAINQINEMMIGLIGAELGTIIDATMFMKFDVATVTDLLKTYGFENMGTMRMFNGYTGNWMDGLVLRSISTYQRISKFVISENYSVRTGPKSALMGQPLQGKIREGGLRLGEMEQHGLGGRGVSRFIKEKFMDHSDGATLYICRTCGRRAIVNESKEMYKCLRCKDHADIAAVPSSKASSQVLATIESQNVPLEYELEPYSYPEYLPKRA